MKKSVRFIIGVDPGTKTGVCLYNRRSKEFTLHTVAPWDFMELIDEWLEGKDPDEFHIYMEDPRKHSAVFSRFRNGWWKKPSERKKMLHIAQGVGSVKRDTDWIEQILESMFLNYTLVKPTSSKWGRKEVKMLTGYEGRSNEHNRDALKLVFGR